VKISKQRLKQIIKEELSRVSETLEPIPLDDSVEKILGKLSPEDGAVIRQWITQQIKAGKINE
jgi:hypothetical protein